MDGRDVSVLVSGTFTRLEEPITSSVLLINTKMKRIKTPSLQKSSCATIFIVLIEYEIPVSKRLKNFTH